MTLEDLVGEFCALRRVEREAAEARERAAARIVDACPAGAIGAVVGSLLRHSPDEAHRLLAVVSRKRGGNGNGGAPASAGGSNA